jgi:hypothetical protein
MFLALPLIAVSAGAQAPTDVPKDHWAYSAVEDLASKGLIKGYPPEGKFFGGRTVTRYEMATIIQRVLGRVDELLTKKADKGDNPGVTPAQLDEVKKLVADFKTELTVLGTDLQKVKDQLAELNEKVGTAQQTADAAKNAADKAVADAADAKTGLTDTNARIQSVIDAIGEQAGRIDKLNASKVDSGFGSIKIDGLFQNWIQSEKNAPNKGVTDGIRLRRAEIKFSGKINPQAYWWAMIDPAKTLALNTTAAGGNITSVSPNNATNILQETVVGFNIAGKTAVPKLAVEIGQQKVPLSMEGIRSASQLLTVERSIFNTLPANNGRVGDIRDAGVLFRYADKGLGSNYPVSKIEGQFGIYNDAGNRQNNTDDNNEKEFMYHLTYRGIPHMTLGAYQEISGGVNGALKTQRQRVGFEGAYTLGRHLLEAEVVRARDAVVAGGAVTNTRLLSTGGYLTYGYSISPAWQVIAKGEYWNPDRDKHGAAYSNEADFTLGLNWYMTGHNSKIQFNWVRKNINGPAPAYLGLDRNLFLANFQQAF